MPNQNAVAVPRRVRTRLFHGWAAGVFMLGFLSVSWILARESRVRPPTFRQFMEKRGYSVVNVDRALEQHLIVNGRIDGKRARFLVDTGFTFNAVETNRATRLPRVSGPEQAALTPPGYPPGSFQFVRLDHFELEGRPFPAEVAIVTRWWQQGMSLPRMPIVGMKGVLDCDAILGVPFLQNHRAVIDYGQPPGLFVRDAARSAVETKEIEESFRLSGFAPVVPIYLPPGKWLVAARVNDRLVSLLVDTGGYRTVLDRSLAQELGVKIRSSVDWMQGGVEGRSSSATDVRIPRLELGESVFTNLTISVADLAPWNLSPGQQSLLLPRGILGSDLLTATRAVLDCEAPRIWFLKSAVR